MNNKNKFQDNEKVLLNGEIVTIKGSSYIRNMQRYSYTIKENPSTFYFEEELTKIK
ncbi:hypothetical protein JOC78_002588 [Bacillus ectoiniformans]|uniref:hypothetical protein n=1 Tax=Bacillus ectoiniformans TaxID=1494429 RepID=UPI0019571686|nr:hypothetical protein [Bacillus ectoiniformans]MBM7649614.1 hypothetical protein [Bacillus ectoiniformans]